jgi:hypothetical protein
MRWRWGVECGHDAVGSGVRARRDGERWRGTDARWGVETVERRRGVVGSGVSARRSGKRRRGTMGSGDGGAAARRGGEWSADTTRWGVETVERRHGVVGSGVRAQRSGERRRGTVGSGDGGVQHDSMGSGVRALAR